MSGFTCMTDEELTKALLFVKDSFTRTENAVRKNPETASFRQVGANIQVSVIEQFEKELRKRGYDVTSEAFGRDILGEIIADKLKEL